MAYTLLDAFAKIRTDKDLATRFTKDPEVVLKELGVPTENLKIEKVPQGIAPISITPAAQRLTVCGSIGYIACASVGGEVQV